MKFTSKRTGKNFIANAKCEVLGLVRGELPDDYIYHATDGSKTYITREVCEDSGIVDWFTWAEASTTHCDRIMNFEGWDFGEAYQTLWRIRQVLFDYEMTTNG